jgi:predicted GNAT family acetyltransferase
MLERVRDELVCGRVEHRRLRGEALTRVDLSASPGLIPHRPRRVAVSHEEMLGDVVQACRAVEIDEDRAGRWHRGSVPAWQDAMMDLDELGRAMAAALRAKTLAVPGGEVMPIDGLQVCLSHLPDPAENFASVATEPQDPESAVAEAEAILRRNGMPFGISVLAGRHPSVDAAVRTSGHRVLFEEPAMSARVADLAPVTVPRDVRFAEADPGDLEAVAALDALAFDGDIEVSRGMYSLGLLHVAHVITATEAGRIVGVATGVPTGGMVGVFGVAVAPAARRRGIGAALTRAAARVGEGSEIAWLSARGEAAHVYERLGFREVGRNQVWVG